MKTLHMKNLFAAAALLAVLGAVLALRGLSTTASASVRQAPFSAPKAEAGPKDTPPLPATFSDEEERTITLPPSATDIGAGPNKAFFDAGCLICHSPKYVSMQPRFSRKVWEAEVRKMMKVFGAPIQEPMVAPIVDYLMAVRGAEEKAAPK